MILAPVFLWSASIDTIDWPKPFATIFWEQITRYAPMIYGLFAVAAVAVMAVGKWQPTLRSGIAVVPLFSVAGAAVMTLLLAGSNLMGWDRHGIIPLSAMTAVISIPVAVTYCLIAGVRWRLRK